MDYYPKTITDLRLDPQHRLWCYAQTIEGFHFDTGDYFGRCPLCHSDTKGLQLHINAQESFNPACCRCGAGKQQIEAAIDQLLASRRKPNGKAPTELPAQPAVKAPRFPLLDFEELCALPEPEWQIDNFFEEQTFVQVFGDTNHGKSLLVLDLALTMTSGRDHWFGRTIRKAGPVVWVNADGGRGMVKRAKAWREVHGSDRKYRFRTLMGAIQLHRPQDTGPFRQQLMEMDPMPALVVFDTLSRCITGVDENLQGPMTQATEACHRMKLDLGCSIILLHHTDKTGERERGSSIVKNETDTQIRVSKEGEGLNGTYTVACKKARDADPFRDFHFGLRAVGESVVIVATDAPAHTPGQRKEANLEEVYLCIEQQPGSTTEALALMLNVSTRTVRRYVNTLMMEARIVEADLPREPGQRGQTERGFYLCPR